MAASPEDRRELEERVRSAWRRGDRDGAARLAIEGYGPELRGLIQALHRDRADADDVFGRFSERLWRGLPGFEWRCSLRSWLYGLVRSASTDHERSRRRWARRRVPLADSSTAARAKQPARSVTRPYLRTEVKDRMSKLREALSRDDQMLLILRVDKELSWTELARVLHDGPAPLDGAALTRESARLRKRFQLVKEGLRGQAERDGIIPSR